MTCRCSDVGLEEVFGDRYARRDARSYRKKGLPARARELLRLIEERTPIKNHSTLEGGAGAGALTVELARRGAQNALALDAIPHITRFGPDLAREFGVAERAHFATADFANLPADTPSADIVILDRVVCCYPDWHALLTNAAAHARRIVALTYPHVNALTRISVGAVNGLQKIFGRRFRAQLHSVPAMHAHLQQSGFAEVALSRYWYWEIAVFQRA
jgi:magnesium-protoporphyrin O-methyltransferase